MMEFSGLLISFPIAELLQWAYNDRRTGSLVIRRSSREKRIYFQEGRTVACLTDHTAEFYGQHLLLGGQISQQQLLQALALCQRESKRLGQVLEELDILTRDEVRSSLRQHIEDVLCDIFLWRHGVFFFRAEAPPREEILAKPIDTVAIAFEGTRWVDEMARIRQTYEHDEIVIRRRGLRAVAESPVPDQVAQLGLRGERIYQAANGEKTLGEIYQEIQGSYFRFLSVAHELHQRGVLEVGDIFEGRVTSVELSLQDVIFEQAASEHIRSAQRHIHSPLGGLDHMVPVWVKQPPQEEWDHMSGEEQKFARQLNGTKRLTDIFSPDEEEWNRQSEMLMLQLAKERIALLPVPLADLDEEAVDDPWWRRLKKS